MCTQLKGKIFSIQRFCLDDGSGIRTNIFLKGCPLRCKWCHNIESLSYKSEIGFYKNNCIGCGKCIEVCDFGAIDEYKNINKSLCTACGKCADVCFSEALVLTGKLMTCDEVMKIIKRDKPFYKESGGITLTGGEPMSQAEFCKEIAICAHKEGISVNIETSGFGKTEDFVDIAPYCDCFLFDCKASDSKHKKLTGANSDVILNNLDILCSLGANVILRIPVVEGANLDEDFIKKIALLAKKYKTINAVHLLPYHSTGVYKSEIYAKPVQSIYKTPDSKTLKEIASFIEKKAQKNVFIK